MLSIEDRRLAVSLASTIILAVCHLAVARIGKGNFEDNSNPANVVSPDGINYSAYDFIFIDWLLKSVAVITFIANMAVCTKRVSSSIKNGVLSLSFMLQLAVALTLLVSVFQVSNFLQLRWFLDMQLPSPPDHSSLVLYRQMASFDALICVFIAGVYLYAINGENQENRMEFQTCSTIDKIQRGQNII